MPEIKTITDANLLALIQTSALLDEQKKDLSGLVSFMTGEERAQLVKLIDDAGKASEEKTRINAEYDKKLKEVSRSESEYARKEFEKFDNNITSGEFAVMESEIQKSDFAGPVKSERTKVGNTQKHGLRNAALFLFFLIALASAILMGLNYL